MAWLEGWDYRKSVTLSRPSGTISNYQMKITVGESSGSPDCDVHCAGHAETDFDDLRFASSDGTTLLSYWIESITGSTPNQVVVVWVKFASIETSSTTFYMYYGNSGAAGASSGDDTFIKFDDFESYSNGASCTKWTQSTLELLADTAQYYKHGKSGKITGESLYGDVTLTTAADPTEIRVFLAVRPGHSSSTIIIYLKDSDGYKGPRIIFNGGYIYHGAESWIELASYSINTWYLLEFKNFKWTATKAFDLYINGTKKVDQGAFYEADCAHLSDLQVANGDFETNTFHLDYAIIMQWLATEPSWGSWGSEETDPTHDRTGDVAFDFSDSVVAAYGAGFGESDFAEFTIESNFIGGQMWFPEFDVAGEAYNRADCDVDFSDSVVVAYGAGFGEIEFPSATLGGTGREVFLAANVAVDFPEFYVNVGPRHYGNGEMVVDEHDWMEVSAKSGARAAITFPSIEIASEGCRVLAGDGEIIYDEMTVASRGGAQAAIEFPDSEINATGTHELLGTVAINMPAGSISATGKVSNLGTAGLVFPASIVEATGYRQSTGAAAISFPDFALEASCLVAPHGDAEIAFPSAIIASSGALCSEADAAISFEFDVLVFGLGIGGNTILRFERHQSW